MSIGIRKTFNLDMVPGGAPPIIHVSAGDVGRPFRANLLYNGETYDLDAVTSVKIRGTKPDNTVFEYALTFDDEDSHVDFVIEEQMAIIAGQVLCEIRLFSGEDTIGSANFILDVETAVYDPEAASESYIPTYETAIQEALETVADDIADLATAAAINDVKQYSDAASASATAAEGSATSAAGSATSAAASAANAFSGTPDGYSTLVSTVNSLNTLNSYVTTTVTLNSDYFDTSSEDEATKCVFRRSGNVVIAEIRNAILQTAPTRWQTIFNIPTGYKPVHYEYVGMKVGASDVANKSEFIVLLGETKMQFFGSLSITSDTHVSLKVVYFTTDAMPTA